MPHYAITLARFLMQKPLVQQARLTAFSAADYLAFEQDSPTRHEFVAGQVFAMAGASERHNQIAGNVYSRLREKLRGGPCRAFIADMKLRVEHADAYYYPDVFVTCDARDTEPYVKRYPAVIVEVLSATTEAIDRREKLRHYRTLETLREYVLISPEERSIELIRRQPNGDWMIHTLSVEDALELQALDCALTYAEVFEDVA